VSDWFDLIKLHHRELLDVAERRRLLKQAKKRRTTATRLLDRILLCVGNSLILAGQWLRHRGQAASPRSSGNGNRIQAPN